MQDRPTNYVYEQQGNVRLRADRKRLIQRVDSIVFDVDGVLINVENSFPHVIADTTQFYFEQILNWPGTARLIDPKETAWYKQAGGFNSDWRLTRAVILTYLWKAAALGSRDLDRLRSAEPGLREVTEEIRHRGGGMEGLQNLLRESETSGALGPEGLLPITALWDERLIDRICCEHYGGDDLCETMYGFAPRYRTGFPGLINREQALLRAASLQGPIQSYGLYTGRTDGEIPPGLRLCQIEGVIAPEAMISGSSPHHKPDPSGLDAVAAILRPNVGCFVGDNVDDLETVLRYEDRRQEGDGVVPFVFAGILHGAPGDRAQALFEQGGADVIVEHVNDLLDYFQGRMVR